MVKTFRHMYVLVIAVISVADGLPEAVATVIAVDDESSLTVVD